MKETLPHHSPDSGMPESGVFGNVPVKSIHSINGAKGGRPPVQIDPTEVVRLRAAGLSWRNVASRLGLGLGTVRRAAAAAERAGKAGSSVRTVPKAIGDAKEAIL